MKLGLLAAGTVMLLTACGGGDGAAGEVTWSAEDVANFTQKQCGSDPSGMSEGTRISASECHCELVKIAEKYSSYRAWEARGQADFASGSSEWLAFGLGVIADCVK